MIRYFIVSCVLSLLCFGCGAGKEVSKSELVGTWYYVETPDKDSFTLRSNGIIVFKAFPDVPGFISADRSLLEGFEGTWHVEENMVKVYLKFPDAHYYTGFNVKFTKQGAELFSFIGDPDDYNRVIFRKCR